MEGGEQFEVGTVQVLEEIEHGVGFGFAPRARNITLYIMAGFEQYDDLMAKLGKFKTGKSCLYINKLADVDENVLRTLIKASAEHIAATN